MRGEVLYEPSPDERYLARLGTVSYILWYSRCDYREAQCTMISSQKMKCPAERLLLAFTRT